MYGIQLTSKSKSIFSCHLQTTAKSSMLSIFSAWKFNFHIKTTLKSIPNHIIRRDINWKIVIFSTTIANSIWSSTSTLPLIAAKTVRGISLPLHTFVGSWCQLHCPRNWDKNTTFVVCQSVKTMKCRYSLIYQFIHVFLLNCLNPFYLFDVLLYSIIGSTWSLQKQHSRQGHPSLQKKICCLYRTYPTWKDKWYKRSSRYPSIKGKFNEHQFIRNIHQQSLQVFQM